MVETRRFEQYWTTRDVAERLHCTVDCVKKWLAQGRIERTKAGSRTLISESALQDFLARSTTSSTQPAA